MENVFEDKIMPEAKEMLKRARLPENPVIAESFKKIYFAELQGLNFKLDERGKAIGHIYPVGIDAILMFNNMEVIL